MNYGILVGVTIGTVLANFGYQMLCSHPDWSAATERTWFQFEALLAVALAGWLSTHFQT